MDKARSHRLSPAVVEHGRPGNGETTGHEHMRRLYSLGLGDRASQAARSVSFGSGSSALTSCVIS